MLFTCLVPYQTYWRICLGANKWIFVENRKNCPFWRHFCSSILGTNGFMKSKVCKYRWYKNQGENKKDCHANLFYLPHTQIFPQFLQSFAHFRGRQIKISKFSHLIPFSISQSFPSNKNNWSIYIYFHASGYFVSFLNSRFKFY